MSHESRINTKGSINMFSSTVIRSRNTLVPKTVIYSKIDFCRDANLTQSRRERYRANSVTINY